MVINWIIFQKLFDNIYNRGGGGSGFGENKVKISERMTGVFGHFLQI